MADTSRKRSRKSKLVPRECVFDEDDIELQVPSTKITKNEKEHEKQDLNKPTTSKEEIPDTSVLKKIKAAAKGSPEKKSPRKFEVDIQVEQFEDDEVDEVTDKNEKPFTPINLLAAKGPECYRPPISLTRDNILEATNEIMSSSSKLVDRILSCCVRNNIGYELRVDHELGWQDSRIQRVLEDWKIWHLRSLHREEPLLYKCYVCEKAWWYLSEFRNHLFNHVEVVISLERKGMHEVNVAAYQSKERFLVSMVAEQDIPADGPCYRCGKDFYSHLDTGKLYDKYYGRVGCLKQFFTCNGLRDHMPFCRECDLEDKPLKCSICRSSFYTDEEMNDHLLLSHTVRTDIPILVKYKNCRKCLVRFTDVNSHVCGHRGPHSQCPYCYKTFPNRMLMEIHFQLSYMSYKCEICDKELAWSCKKYEHMLTHTDKFMLVRRCIRCDDLKVFLDTYDARAHRAFAHDINEMKHLNYFPQILVPSSCIEKSESERKQQELKNKKQKETSVCEQEIKTEPDSEAMQEKEQLSKQENLQGLTQKELDSATRFFEENITIKEEPLDTDECPKLVIKEEPTDDFENTQEENQTEKFEHQIQVKEELIEDEFEEEYDEYEGDIIKLNFDIEGLLTKQESTQESYGEESILEPEVLIQDKKKRIYKCTNCDFEANHREYKAHIENDCEARISFKYYFCTKCQNNFASWKKYLMHFEEHKYKKLSCPECLVEFKKYAHLGAHVTTHIKQNYVRLRVFSHGDNVFAKTEYQCKKCKKVVNQNSFFEHWELHINNRPEMPVRVTSTGPTTSGDLPESTLKECLNLIQAPYPKQCNHCHRIFHRVYECKRHIIEHLLADAYSLKHIHQELRCQICSNGFPNSEKYKEHMRHHGSLPVYKCTICDKTFSDSSNFTKHKKVHNFNVIICDLCGKKFQSKVTLAKHFEKHKATEPVSCKICNKIFYFETSYRRHVRYFHEKTTLGFRCVICGQRFDSLKLKWDHMWDVHKERKFKADCPICKKSFRKYSDVKLHAKTEHCMNVSVYSVKSGKNNSFYNKKNKNLNNITKMMDVVPKIKFGTVETLVVYESD